MKPILDVACGSKMFWFDKNNPNVEFCDNRIVPYHEYYPKRSIEIKPDTVCDFTALPLAETCGKYLSKGRLVAVSGRLQMRNYEDSEGKRRYVTEVVADEVQFLERQNSGQAPQEQPQQPFAEIDQPDDLPF